MKAAGILARRAAVLASLVLLAAPGRADEAAAWEALRAGGHVAFIRHASTVAGFGDPSGYTLDDCATQRNLSEKGREESRRIGERLTQEYLRQLMADELGGAQLTRRYALALQQFGRVAHEVPGDVVFDGLLLIARRAGLLDGRSHRT